MQVMSKEDRSEKMDIQKAIKLTQERIDRLKESLPYFIRYENNTIERKETAEEIERESFNLNALKNEQRRLELLERQKRMLEESDDMVDRLTHNAMIVALEGCEVD